MRLPARFPPREARAARPAHPWPPGLRAPGVVPAAARRPRWVAGLLFLAGGASFGCAAGGLSFGGRSARPPFPDAAAVEAGARARAAFKDERRPYGAGGELAARVEEVGRAAVRERFAEDRSPAAASSTPADGAGGGRADRPPPAPAAGSAPGPDGWRFVLTDDAAPEAFLFADGSVFVTRGALAALGGERPLGALFRGAAARYTDREFRRADGSLVPQPIPLPLPCEGEGAGGPKAAGGAADPPAGSAADERWIALLDGLAYGEPPERGGARGRDLYLPRAGLRLRAPPGYLFAPGADGRHAAARGHRPDLVVEELGPGDSTAVAATVGPDGVFHAGGAREQRRRTRELAEALLERAEGRPVEFVEAVRGGGIRGVAARLGGRRADADPAGEAGEGGREAGGGGDGECGPGSRERPAAAEPGEPAAAASAPPSGRLSASVPGRRSAGAAPGYLALLDAPRRVVEVRLDCGPRALAACENSFMAMLRSAAPYPAGAAPGWLRLRAARVPPSVSRPESARRALDALVRGGESDVPAFVLRELNRARLDRPAAPGDLLLVARREPPPPGAGSAAAEAASLGTGVDRRRRR